MSTRRETSRLPIRRAREPEAAVLSQIAFRAKASHGYDAAFMEACRAELTVAPADFVRRVFWAAEDSDGQVVGFAGLWPAVDGVAEVDPLYVEPTLQRGGVGRLLWFELEAHARATGAERIVLDSDPHAVGFYERVGCRVIGEAPSGSIPGRMLPRMEKVLT
ncbi:MAG: GNAT family N-acetyltransferase [Rhizobiales bacterium]|nr:GNAT family N-acetyltransferase [Hyphomicrobiales bacterium]